MSSRFCHWCCKPFTFTRRCVSDNTVDCPWCGKANKAALNIPKDLMRQSKSGLVTWTGTAIVSG